MTAQQSERGTAQPPRTPPYAAVMQGLLGGAALALLEVALVVACARDLFLAPIEMLRFAALSATALPGAGALLAVLATLAFGALQRARAAGGPEPVQRAQRMLFAAAAPVCGWALWLLTAGRRVRALPGRGLIVALCALAAAALLAWAAGALLRAHAHNPRRPWLAFALLGGAALLLSTDALALRRLYPAFHLGLAALTVVLALCSAAFSGLRANKLHGQRAALAALACGLAALLSVRSLAAAPNARFAIRESAPLSGKLLQLARPPEEPSRPAPPRPAAPRVSAAAAGSAGIDLGRSDVLLITVDALRADRLRAYGGSGLTPAIDALAEESAVFAHAYTPTPHTSYAISSLFTAKFMQPLLSLAETADDHPTLPKLLRRHGYRTAAFYPPAIFFVDEERFEFLRKDNLGFEYVKAMFAKAADRVTQLEEYLSQAPPEHPLFVWVHLFEPHEPYDPPPEFARGDTPVLRYDGEVAAADDAVGKLVAAFRRARPGATVVLTADHGEEFGDHGGHHHGTALYEEHVHVPLLWSSPGKVQPQRVQSAVEILDIGTTLLAALGIPREARMRGDDLCALLAGTGEPAQSRAFSSIDGARMLTDGQRKLICRESECRLFDLSQDPGERRDLSQEQPDATAALRHELGEFVASLPRLEALAMRGGGAWPQSLARARLGDASAGPELIPLLSSERTDVRAAAARAIGELGVAQARNVLARMRSEDPDAEVAAEAAVAALRLGELPAREQVTALLRDFSPVARRAALALAHSGDHAGEAILLATAADHALEEPERLAALRALEPPASIAARDALIALLPEVRLRPVIAEALGRLGDRRAAPALEAALRVERYPESRVAEVRALLQLGARAKAVELTRRFLGTASSVPDGVALLAQAGALASPSGAGADVRASAQLRRGAWECRAEGCRPLPGASLVLPSRGAPRGPLRVIVRAHVQGTSQRLRIGAAAYYLNPGEVEVALEHEPVRGALALELEADTGVAVQTIAVVKATEDIPPPPPEPEPGLTPNPIATAIPSTSTNPSPSP